MTDTVLDFDEAVRAAWAAEGYLNDDGTYDKAKVRERMFAVLQPNKVMNPRERGDKATTRGSMVAEVFPSLPGPEDFEDMEDPMLALAVWKSIDSYLWNETRPAASSALQRLVGLNMGNGYVLLRTTIYTDRVEASYISDNVACIEQDLILPNARSLERKATQIRKDLEMLILRKPEQARRWVKSFDSQFKSISSSGHAQLVLTAEAATAAQPDPGLDDDDSDSE